MTDSTAPARHPGYLVDAIAGTEYERPNMETLGRMLKLWGIRPYTMLPSGAAVVIHNNTWWTLTDNGGEVNVERINDMGSMRSVPYQQMRALVPVGRLAWFCAMVVLGEEIPHYGTNDSVDDITPDLAA